MGGSSSSQGTTELQTQVIDSPLNRLIDPTSTELLRLAGLDQAGGRVPIAPVSFDTNFLGAENILPRVELPSQVPGFNIPGDVSAPTLTPEVNPFNIASAPDAMNSPFFAPLLSAVFDPLELTPGRQALLQPTLDIASGFSALRGLDSPTPSGISQVVLPELQKIRGADIANLGSFLFKDIDSLLQGRSQTLGAESARFDTQVGQRADTLRTLSDQFGTEVGQRGDTLSALDALFRGQIGQRGTDIDALLTDIQRAQLATTEQAGQKLEAETTRLAAEQAAATQRANILGQLLGTSLPQIVAGQGGTTSGSSFNIL